MTFSNRIGVSPMCQYSAQDGFANDWHTVHIGARAQGGPGLVLLEASAVVPEGRITPDDLGIYKDDHVPGLTRIVDFIHSQGVRAGIQLAHAGRKASMASPFIGDRLLAPEDGGWQPVAPSAIPFAPHYGTPHPLSLAQIDDIVRAFAQAARRAANAGFDVVEIHAAHGYLLHEFLSPLSNQRTDIYGGSFENRIRLLLQIVDAVRDVWPDHLPLFVRISSTDWAENGWTESDSVALAGHLRAHGVDLIDCSSGALVPNASIPVAPGYQVPFAARIRAEAAIPTAAVGMITDPHQANAILAEEKADLVFLARAMLHDPYWPLHAAEALGESASWPVQYLRAAPRHSLTRASITRPELASEPK